MEIPPAHPLRVKKKSSPKFLWLIGFLLILFLGIFGGYKVGLSQKKETPPSQVQSKNKYVSFINEIYDTITQNYWDKVEEEKMVQLFVLASEKAGGQFLDSQPKKKEELIKALSTVINKISKEDDKKKFVTLVADAVLSNLQPLNRSRLYSQKEETNLQNLVQNKNPEVDQYKTLGLNKGASSADVQKNYQQLTEKLKKEASPEAKQKMAEVEKAYQTLGNEDSKKNYDAAGIETTVESKLIKPNIVYFKLTRFSPTTFDDLKRTADKYDSGDVLDTLILDLRNNIGGAFDGLPYFVGPFIGNDQYAYQLFHQGDKTDFKTKIGLFPSLARYKKIVILINENSQSTAEMMSSILKKYHVGVLVGNKTKGWGTIEKVFPLNNQIDKTEKYSVFLVHSITLREDGQPIEGRGVEPNIYIKDAIWGKQLLSYFNSPEIVQAVKEVW